MRRMRRRGALHVLPPMRACTPCVHGQHPCTHGTTHARTGFQCATMHEEGQPSVAMHERRWPTLPMRARSLTVDADLVRRPFTYGFGHGYPHARMAFRSARHECTRPLCSLSRDRMHVFAPAITWNDHSHGAMMTEANNGPRLDGFDRFYYGF